MPTKSETKLDIATMHFPSDMRSIWVDPARHEHSQSEGDDHLIVRCNKCVNDYRDLLHGMGGRVDPRAVPLTWDERQEQTKAERENQEITKAIAAEFVRRGTQVIREERGKD